MNKPNLVNIDRFKKKVRNTSATSLTLQTVELKGLDSDIDALIQYTVHLQAAVIALQTQANTPRDIEIGGGDFFQD